MDFSTLRDMEQMSEYKPKYPNEERPTVLPLGYITDRTKSVIWNEEQVEASKKAEKAYRAKRTRCENEAYDRFRSDLAESIMEDLNVKGPTQAQVSVIISKAYEDGHSYGYHEVITHAEELVELINDFLEKANEKDSE